MRHGEETHLVKQHHRTQILEKNSLDGKMDVIWLAVYEAGLSVCFSDGFRYSQALTINGKLRRPEDALGLVDRYCYRLLIYFDA